jgi:hypothetical protein
VSEPRQLFARWQVVVGRAAPAARRASPAASATTARTAAQQAPQALALGLGWRGGAAGAFQRLYRRHRQ